MKIKFLSSIALALILTACSTSKPPNVLPLSAGQYKTTGFGEDENAAEGAAIKAATEACEKQKRRLEVASREVKYKGAVSEETSKNLKTLSTVASFAGVFLPTLKDDNDYEVTLQFTCAA